MATRPEGGSPVGTMRAVLFHEHGGRDVLRLEKTERPEPGAGEVRVELRAAGVNHLDVHVRRGLPNLRTPLPHVPGCDGAGVVAAVGPGVADALLGARVALNPLLPCLDCEFCLTGDHALCRRVRILGEHVRGTYAEHVVVPAQNALPMPDGFPFETAAAAPLVYQTAWRMLKRARVAPGEDVLVLGASGGVASAAVQIAKLRGARVLAATRGAEKAERARRLGADVVLDTAETPDFARTVREITGKRGVDVVVDHVGKATYPGAVRSLRRGGRYVACGATTGNDPPAELHYLFWNQLELLGSTMGSLSETAEVMALVFAGRLRPEVDAVLPLEEAAEAHRRLEEREQFGKVVLRI